MQEREKIKQLFERYRSGQCTPAEQARLHAWLNRYAANEAHGLDDLGGRYAAERTRVSKRWLPYAAALLIAGATVWYFWADKKMDGIAANLSAEKGVISPGGNRATLTLADGRTIDLSEVQNGIVIGDGITYLDGSAVNTGDNPHTGPATHDLQLTTPKGGTYQVTLPDGTRVWLNAASTLMYPSQFEGNERKVEIEGEGYFVVAKNKDKPFTVVSRGQEIHVLGTEFNVSAYEEDATAKTTLVEGAVQITNLVSNAVHKLLPGQQVATSGAQSEVQAVETDQYTAWKNGLFYFKNTPAVEVIKQIERWYDVEVVYKDGTAPTYTFTGEMERVVSLETVLEVLKISGIRCHIIDRKLIVE